MKKMYESKQNCFSNICSSFFVTKPFKVHLVAATGRQSGAAAKKFLKSHSEAKSVEAICLGTLGNDSLHMTVWRDSTLVLGHFPYLTGAVGSRQRAKSLPGLVIAGPSGAVRGRTQRQVVFFWPEMVQMCPRMSIDMGTGCFSGPQTLFVPYRDF